MIVAGIQAFDDVPPEFQALTWAGTTGRNDRCPCGSGQKFKKCCGRA